MGHKSSIDRLSSRLLTEMLTKGQQKKNRWNRGTLKKNYIYYLYNYLISKFKYIRKINNFREPTIES